MAGEVRVLSFAVYAVLCLGGGCKIEAAQGNELLERTIDAIRMVESSGLKNPKDGDQGRAIGGWQIHRGYWRDGTQALGVNWPYADARNDERARKVVRAYLLRYAPNGTPETWARIHNGGPTGHKKKATLIYLAKFRKNLDIRNKKP